MRVKHVCLLLHAQKNMAFTLSVPPDAPKILGAVTAYTWEGNPANISCEVEAHPGASVLWFRDGVQLPFANATNVKIYGGPSVSFLEVSGFFGFSPVSRRSCGRGEPVTIIVRCSCNGPITDPSDDGCFVLLGHAGLPERLRQLQLHGDKRDGHRVQGVPPYPSRSVDSPSERSGQRTCFPRRRRRAFSHRQLVTLVKPTSFDMP